MGGVYRIELHLTNSSCWAAPPRAMRGAPGRSSDPTGYNLHVTRDDLPSSTFACSKFSYFTT